MEGSKLTLMEQIQVFVLDENNLNNHLPEQLEYIHAIISKLLIKKGLDPNKCNLGNFLIQNPSVSTLIKRFRIALDEQKLTNPIELRDIATEWATEVMKRCEGKLSN